MHRLKTAHFQGPEPPPAPGTPGKAFYHGTNSAGLVSILASRDFRVRVEGIEANVTPTLQVAEDYASDKALTKDRSAFVLEVDPGGHLKAIRCYYKDPVTYHMKLEARYVKI